MQGRNVQPNMMSMQTGHAVDAATIVVPSAKKLCTNNVGPATATTTTDSNKMMTNGNGPVDGKHQHNAQLIQSQVVGKEAKLQPQINGNHNNEECNKENDNKYDNNSKKFAFLAQQTIPDYRPQTVSC